MVRERRARRRSALAKTWCLRQTPEAHRGQQRVSTLHTRKARSEPTSRGNTAEWITWRANTRWHTTSSAVWSETRLALAHRASMGTAPHCLKYCPETSLCRRGVLLLHRQVSQVASLSVSTSPPEEYIARGPDVPEAQSRTLTLPCCHRRRRLRRLRAARSLRHRRRRVGLPVAAVPPNPGAYRC